MIAARLALAGLALVTAVAAVPDGPHERLRLSAARGALRLENSRDGTAVFAARNMKPGDSSTGSVSVTNRGEAAARLVLRSSAPIGTLADVLRVAVAGVGEGDLASLAGCHELGTLPAGATRTYRFTATWPAGAADNHYAGASVRVDEHWALGQGCAPAGQAEPRLAISHRRVGLVHGRAQVRVRCAGGSRCAGAIYLSARPRLSSRRVTRAGLVRARFQVAPGRRATLALHVPPASRAALRSRHRAIVLAVLKPDSGSRTARLLTLVSR